MKQTDCGGTESGGEESGRPLEGRPSIYLLEYFQRATREVSRHEETESFEVGWRRLD